MKSWLVIGISIVIGMAALFVSQSSLAASSGGGLGGGSEFTFGIGYSGATQSDINSAASAEGASGAQLSGGMEYSVTYLYRFPSSIFALAFRPSYFTQTAGASGMSNSVTAILFYPMLRFYPLESPMFHLYMQAGVGYASLSGTTTYNSASVSYTGTDFGAIAGIGVEICFTDHQCATVEGNARYNAIPRSIVGSTTGTTVGNLSTPTGHELEYSSSDVQNTLSGVVGIIAYTYKF